jgi:hypothetical protein
VPVPMDRAAIPVKDSKKVKCLWSNEL